MRIVATERVKANIVVQADQIGRVPANVPHICWSGGKKGMVNKAAAGIKHVMVELLPTGKAQQVKGLARCT